MLFGQRKKTSTDDRRDYLSRSHERPRDYTVADYYKVVQCDMGRWWKRRMTVTDQPMRGKNRFDALSAPSSEGLLASHWRPVPRRVQQRYVPHTAVEHRTHLGYRDICPAWFVLHVHLVERFCRTLRGIQVG
jgi:hypothetical protein